MKLRVVKLAPGLSEAIFFWEEGDEGNRSKVVRSLKQDQEFIVDDMVGHEVISKYKESFQVVHYGGETVQRKMAVPPKNTMVKEEKTKEDVT